MQEKAFAIIDQSHEQMLKLWSDLVNMDSGSTYKAGVDAVADRIEAELKAIGFKTRQVVAEKAGNTLIAEYGDCSKDFIFFTGHMDTVFNKVGEAKERPFTIDEKGLAHGPGCLDMKGGDTILITVMRTLIGLGYNKHGFKIVLAGDEESAHPYSNAPEIIKEEAKGAKCAFNFETGFPDNGLVVTRKGVLAFQIETFGRATHVGNAPENGRSAVIEMAHHMIDLEALTDLDKGYNITCGVISGGTVRNSTPDYCKCLCDMRVNSVELMEEMTAVIEKTLAKQYVPDTTTKMTVQAKFLPQVMVPGTEELFSFVKDIYEELGYGTPYMKHVGGGSDSAYTTAAGVPTLCAMGVQGAGNHTVTEYAIVETLYTRAKLMCAILLRI